jgi:coenzyme Q-binding protein COQ10
LPVHRENRVLPCRRDQFFDLVADVESYPEFLPLWRSARIYRKKGDVYYTEQVVGMGPLMSQRFRSRTKLDRPTDIEVTSDAGVFKHLRIVWHFESTPEDGCRVDFEMSCEASSPMMRRFIDLMLLETARGMVEAFEKRARKLCGPDTGP